jgi:hypothetical protein
MAHTHHNHPFAPTGELTQTWTADLERLLRVAHSWMDQLEVVGVNGRQTLGPDAAAIAGTFEAGVRGIGELLALLKNANADPQLAAVIAAAIKRFESIAASVRASMRMFQPANPDMPPARRARRP